MKSLLPLLLALLPCCDGALLLNAGGHALQVHSSVLDETFGLASLTAGDGKLEIENGMKVEQAKPRTGKKGIRYKARIYNYKEAVKTLRAKRRALFKKRKPFRVLRKKCWKCVRGKAKCTTECKKFKNRRKPKSRKACKGTACYRRKGAVKASKKRRLARIKKRKAYRVLRKKCWKCMRGTGKCTTQCKKFKNRRKPKSRKACKGTVCYRRKGAYKASKKRRAMRTKCFKAKKCRALYSRARRSRAGFNKCKKDKDCLAALLHTRRKPRR